MNNRKGFTNILILVMAPIALMLVLSTISLSLSSRQQAIVSKNRGQLRALLNSLLDYTVYGVKNRWCFTANWEKDVNCSVTHDRSIDRLILNKESLIALRDATGQAQGDLLINEFSTTINLQTVPATHPLAEVVNSALAGSDAFETATIQIRRVNNQRIPVRGDEIVLEVRVTAAANRVLFANLSEFSAVSRVVVMPRQLNYFSLIVPRDLRLDQPGTSTLQGDANIPVGATGQGIVFESPVYVNRRVYLPPEGQQAAAMFMEKLVVGSEGLYVADGNFEPSSAGGEGHQTYSQLGRGVVFGRGLEIDGEEDQGLNVLAGLSTSTPPGASLVGECRDLMMAERELSATRESELLIKRNSPGTGTPYTHPELGTGISFDYQIGFNLLNRFQPQTFNSFREAEYSNTAVFAGTDRALMRARIEVDLVRHDGTPVENALSPTDCSSSRCYVVNIGSGEGGTGGTTFHARMLSHNPSAPNSVDLDVWMRMRPIFADGRRQPNRMRFELRFAGGLHRIQRARLVLEPFDLAYFAGRNRRYNRDGHAIASLVSPQYRRTVTINYQRTGTNLVEQTFWNSVLADGHHRVSTGAYRQMPPDHVFVTSPTYEGLRDICYGEQSSIGHSFAGASWDNDDQFVSQTRASWWFARPSPSGPVQEYADSVSGPVTVLQEGGFPVRSIIGRCSVPASVSLLTGFYVCDEFRIEPRTTRLRIIGTVIAGRTFIDTSAVTHGVNWRSIYHPLATHDLRLAGVLRPFTPTDDCPLVPATPVWHPALTPRALYDNYYCNTISLQHKADPFRWTKVSPDCGWSGTSPTPKCMRKPRRLLVREINRESDL